MTFYSTMYLFLLLFFYDGFCLLSHFLFFLFSNVEINKLHNNWFTIFFNINYRLFKLSPVPTTAMLSYCGNHSNNADAQSFLTFNFTTFVDFELLWHSGSIQLPNPTSLSLSTTSVGLQLRFLANKLTHKRLAFVLLPKKKNEYIQDDRMQWP
jgi:hypothetical protein